MLSGVSLESSLPGRCSTAWRSCPTSEWTPRVMIGLLDSSRRRTERHVTQPSSFWNSLMSTVTGS